MLLRAAFPLLLAAAVWPVGAASAGEPPPSAPLVLRGARVLTVTKGEIEDGTIVVADGKIAAVGRRGEVAVPEGATVIELEGRFVLPGIIDTHSHMGVWPWGVAHVGTGDGNEATDPLTPHVRAEDSFFLEDPAFERARAGGVTTIQVLPGSANLTGGESLVVKLRPWANTLAEMRFEGAPRGMKWAFGENPKRTHGEGRGRLPSTRMGSLALLREALAESREYGRRWAEYETLRGTANTVPRPHYDARAEALLPVLRGEVRLNVHCYRKDDILSLFRLEDEFGLTIGSLHHALEAYKIAPEIARRDIGVATFVDWWGFKMEAWDAIPQNAAVCARAGVRVSIHSDSSDVVQRLYHEAAKAVKYGLAPEDGLKAITYWPATILGIDGRVGSIEVGKEADLAVFTKHPYDMYTRVEMTLIDGRIAYRMPPPPPLPSPPPRRPTAPEPPKPM